MVPALAHMRPWYSRKGEGRGRRANSGEKRMKRTGQIDGRPLYECILDKQNLLEAIDNAAKDHAHDPQVI